MFLVLISALSARVPTQHDSAVERLGTHILLEVFDAPFTQLNSTVSQLTALQAAVAAGGLTVVGELSHQFPVMGASAILLISESHLSIHAWPERGYAAVDLFTCGAAEPLPCSEREPISFGDDGWRCSNGAPVARGLQSKLWVAVRALVATLQAGGAMLTWMDRGLPHHAKRAAPPPSSGFGWLGGLENEAALEL